MKIKVLTTESCREAIAVHKQQIAFVLKQQDMGTSVWRSGANGESNATFRSITGRRNTRPWSLEL